LSTSIFQGNFQLVWNSTSLDALKTCPRKYQLSIIDGWQKKSKSRHLVFGGHYATAMENFFKHLILI